MGKEKKNKNKDGRERRGLTHRWGELEQSGKRRQEEGNQKTCEWEEQRVGRELCV